MALDVLVGRAARSCGAAGRPHDGGVARARDVGGAVRVQHAPQYGADDDRHPDLVGDGLDLGAGVGVGEGVDVRGVLRPDHQVGAGSLPGRDLGGEQPGLADVVVEDGAALAREVQPGAGHVALDGRDGDGPVAGLGGGVGRDGEADERAEQHGDEGADEGGCRAGTGTWVPTQERRDQRPQAGPGEHHGEPDQRRAPERGELPVRPAGLAEGELGPREAAPRDPLDHGLPRHPEARDPQRRRGQPRHERDQGHRHRDGQHHDRQRAQPHRAHVGPGPVQQRVLVGQRREGAPAERGADPAAVDHREQQRDPQRGRPPPAQRRERRVEREAGDDRPGRAPRAGLQHERSSWGRVFTASHPSSVTTTMSSIRAPQRSGK